jgi:PAS domain S-box-containing protein
MLRGARKDRCVAAVTSRAGPGVHLPGMVSRIKTRLLLALAAAFLLVASIVTLAYVSTHRLIDVSREVVSESEVLVELQETLSTMRDAESAQRGYILTGQERYRPAYDAAVERLRIHRARLGAIAGDAPGLRRIDALSGRKLIELDSTLAAYRADGPEAARLKVLQGSGKALMDSLGAAVAAAVDDRSRMVEQATLRTQQRSRAAIVMVSALSLVGLVALASLALALLRFLGERQRAEHSLKAEYRDFVGQVRDYAIFRLDPDGHASSWNEGVQLVLGYPEREFLGLAPEAIFTPEDVAAGIPEQELGFAAKTGTANNDRWMMRRDGTRFFAAGITTALRDESGRLAGFTKVMRDQTAWKETEEALRQSETRYRLVARASREAIWDRDLGTDRMEWNDAVEPLFGYPPGIVEPTAAWWVDRIHPDDRDRILTVIRSAIDGDAEFWNGDYRFRCADGEYAQVSNRALIARDESGRAARMLGTMANVTERRRAEEKLAQAQRMEAVGRLAGGIAHDLNNMLTTIIGYSTFADQGLPADAPARADIGEIRRAADRSAALTRSLLAFARREIIQPRSLDLHEVLRDLERMLRPAMGESIEIQLDLAPGPATVFADRARLEQVFLNLALNARDAMPAGGRLRIGTSTVTLGPDAEARHPGIDVNRGRYHRITLSDTGHGMDRETLGRIFEPFYTTKPAGEGTGLGLATVYGTVKQAGGFVWAYSEPGFGTIFSVYLPESLAVPGPEYQPGEASPAVQGGSETILVVEDEPTVRLLACRMLSAAGYRCLSAANASEALVRLDDAGEPVDLMLTDIVMPGGSGAELAEQARPGHPEMAVLFSSGFTDDDVIRRGLMEPGRPFIHKPWSPQELLERVRELLDGRGGRGGRGGRDGRGGQDGRDGQVMHGEYGRDTG